MTRLASWTLAAALAVTLSLTVLAPGSRADALAATPGSDDPTHSLTIEYQDGTDLRRARLTIAPLSDGVDPLWRGRLHSISVLTTKGQWIVIQSFLSSGHYAEAEAMLPSPEDIAVIFVRPQRGETIGWTIEQGGTYTEVEWTYLNQAGQEIAAPTRRGAEEACSTSGCEIVDPWTCECVRKTGSVSSNEVGPNSLRIVPEGGGNDI